MAHELIGGDRPLRVCDLCGGVDDHPRHVLAGGVPGAVGPPDAAVVARVMDAVEGLPSADRVRLLTELYDTGSQDRHYDCCRDAGCPTTTCDEATAGAEGKRGAELLAHLMKGI